MELSLQRQELESALLNMDRVATEAALVGATAAGLTPANLGDELITPVLAHIGDEWERGAIALSQVYMSARVLEEVLDTSLAIAVPEPMPPTIGVGVLEDYHALGKRILQAVLASSGHKVVDLGTGLSVDEMIERAEGASVEVLMISVLMFNKALHVSQVTERLEERGMGHIPVVVGGAPFLHDPELWRRVGADACGRSAADALRIVADLREGGVK